MLLTVQNLSVSNILSNINLTVDQDETVTIFGPSGSGKSTLLKALARLEDHASGQIDLLGKPAISYPIDRYRQLVSYAVQSANLFGQTVRDNLDLPFNVRQKAIDEDLQKTMLAAVDLDATFLDKQVADLSGGQRQRVAVLRNLIFPPKVLLLDEITTGLDETTKQVVWRFINEEQGKNHFAILSVTHDQQEIQSAKKTLQVIGGKLDD
ncbi:ABC transporter ATP-binding protein [Convivina intestini]|uniref:Putative ABC transport system ATP-binding protein n=1 Tax=Convivina intestini TaxID=1505726 RepID=A0A2U1DC74_9LACO|nr:ATP-binding cassette domain-containing protein [Convivina intestini]PVY85256.1 putative ABC transport system ATP-binding protein [Convivina intestini]CAH1850101.1 putative iron export ATP-binding protein FetA [Convivina intestini]CAH1852625.1 putative iron export ATP-binding protein FetA [Convivina intestini]SDB87111.1 putative ABC transport system ATP-binding protein [Leuconostocaceae bacterium R-53105]